MVVSSISVFFPNYLILFPVILPFLFFALAPESHPWSAKPAGGFKSCFVCLSSDWNCLCSWECCYKAMNTDGPPSRSVFLGAFTHSLSSLKSALLMPKFHLCFPSCHQVLNSILSWLLWPQWPPITTSLMRPLSKSRRASFPAGSLWSCTWG